MKTLLALVLALSSASCTECTGPGNAWAYPNTGVPVEKVQCQYYQIYQAISPTTDYPSCGYTVAFGPQGQLMHPADGYLLQAEWGEVVASQAECEDSHTSGQAWGYRCDNAHCTAGEWENFGALKSRSGYWNPVSNTCYLSLGFNASGVDYNTVQVQVNAYSGSGSSKVRRRAKGYIYVFRHSGGCLTATPVPPPPHNPSPSPHER